MFSVECFQHSTLNIQHYSSTAACAAANFEDIIQLFADSEFPYLHTLEELFYGISLIHPLDIHQ